MQSAVDDLSRSDDQIETLADDVDMMVAHVHIEQQAWMMRHQVPGERVEQNAR